MIRPIIISLLLLLSIPAMAQWQTADRSEFARTVALGDAFMQAGTIDKGLDLYTAALTGAISAQERWAVVDRLTKYYVDNGRPREALNFFDDFIEAGTESLDSIKLIDVYTRMGTAYYIVRDYIKAMKSFYAAQEICEEQGSVEQHMLLYTNMAKTILRAGDINIAEDLLNKAEHMAYSAKASNYLVEIFDTKARLYMSRKDWEQALVYRDLYVKEITYQWERERQEIIDSKNPWHAERRGEVDLDDVDLTRKLYDTIEEKERTIVKLYIAIGFLALCTLALFIYFSRLLFKRKKKRNEEISKVVVQKEKMVMASSISSNFINISSAIMKLSDKEFMTSENIDDGQLYENSKLAYNTAKSLYLIINNMLEWNKNIEERLLPRKIQFPIVNRIEHVVTIFKLIAEDKGIDVETDIKNDTSILADPSQFDIIMCNVIFLALQHTMRGGRVNISTLEYEHRTSIIVDDTGVGLPKSVVDRINGADYGFGEEDVIRSKEEQALLICRSLAEGNGGLLELTSTEGNGTTITLLFFSRLQDKDKDKDKE